MSIWQTKTFWAALITLIVTVAGLWIENKNITATLSAFGAFFTAVFFRDAILKTQRAEKKIQEDIDMQKTSGK